MSPYKVLFESELEERPKQLTSFIEAKGLVAAFQEFLKPKPVIKPPKEEPRRERPHKAIPDVKKRHAPVR